MTGLDVEVVCDRRQLIFNLSIHQVDALAWLCSERSDFEPENINLDDDPDPGVVKALVTRGLVVIDADDHPTPTKAGLAVAEKVDQLYRQGRQYHGLRDAALVSRVRASGKSKARRGPRVERSEFCVSCQVERTEDTDKYWRRDKCNRCYQRERYHQKKARMADESRQSDEPGILAPRNYEAASPDQRRAMLSVRLCEDDYYLFTALTAIDDNNQTNASMVRSFIRQAADQAIANDPELTMEGLLKTGKTLFELSGKKFKSRTPKLESK